MFQGVWFSSPLMGEDKGEGDDGVHPITCLTKTLMTLNPKQDQALSLLLSGSTEAQVARKVRVARTTVSYWRNHDPDFRAELTARRNLLWEQHRDDLATLYRQAIDILRQALNSPQENVRIRAAIGIAKFPAIQSYLKPEKPAEEEEIDMLEVLGFTLNQMEAEGRGVQPKREEGEQRQLPVPRKR